MRMKRRIRTDVCLILCGILVWFLADARQLRLEAAKALTLCAGTVIPALFPSSPVCWCGWASDNGWRPIWLA